ncbi:hypothetical protein KJ953_00885 [Patescibacteria group bacterium]|nr:hypothetical protein [Patescibacteria group bacterium]
MKKNKQARIKSFDKFRKKLFQDPKFVQEYNALEPEFAIIKKRFWTSQNDKERENDK